MAALDGVTVETFRARFAEFPAATFGIAAVERAIETATQLCNISTDAQLHCVAHLLALLEQNQAEADGGAGEVRQEHIGPKMVMYKTQAMTEREVFFSSSPYGRLMLQLERRNPRMVLSAFSA